MKLTEKHAKHPTSTHHGNEIAGHQFGNQLPNAQSSARNRPVKANSRKLMAGNLTLQNTNTAATPNIMANTFVSSRPRRFVNMPSKNTASNEP